MRCTFLSKVFGGPVMALTLAGVLAAGCVMPPLRQGSTGVPGTTPGSIDGGRVAMGCCGDEAVSARMTGGAVTTGEKKVF